MYNSSGNAHGVCSFKQCPVPGIGQVYAQANADPKNPCAVKNCESFPGERFVKQNNCTRERCSEDKLAIGYYFALHPTDPHGNPCHQEQCTHRGNNKFKKGYSNDPRACPKDPCTGAKPPKCGFAQLNDCSPAECAKADSNADAGSGVAVGITVTILILALLIGAGAIVLWRIRRATPEAEPEPNDNARERGQTVGEKIAAGAVDALALKDFLLGSDEVVLGRRVAGGCGGQIFVGKFGMQEVALKESFEVIMNEYTQEMITEAIMMTKLRHPNVVQFFGIWQYNESPCETRVFLVMEFCNSGDLHDAAQDANNDLSKRLKWVLQVAAAMSYLHSRSPPVIHRDLKAQNVLLDVHGVAKVRHIRNACRNVYTIKRLKSLCLTDTHLFDVCDYAGS